MTGTYQLRPMSVGEILDGAFAIYRREFAIFMGIAVVGYGAATVVNTYVTVSGGPFLHVGLAIVGYLLSGVGGLLAAAATVWVISETYLGREPELGVALRFAVGRMWPLLVAGLFKTLLIGLAFIAFFVPGFIVACGYAVVSEVVVLEQPDSAGAALGRSWQLTRDHRRRAFALGGVVFTLVALPGIIAPIIAAMVPGLEVLAVSLSGVISALIYPILASAFTLFYYDLRVRKEAFDLEILNTQLGAPGAA